MNEFTPVQIDWSEDYFLGQGIDSFSRKATRTSAFKKTIKEDDLEKIPKDYFEIKKKSYPKLIGLFKNHVC